MRLLVGFFFLPAAAYAIMAGDEFGLPEDRPSWRVDAAGASSPYNFVGGLEMTHGASRYLGTGVALSPHWVLSAGHNVDFNDDGQADTGLSVTFHLPGLGAYSTTAWQTHPSFTGFGQPSIHHDLSLLYFIDPLPVSLTFPVLGSGLGVGDVVTLVGFGRSGYGSHGYTTPAGTENRRTGQNTVESLTPGSGGVAELFRYTFEAPDEAGSLGNDVETIIGPGDSGGPALVDWDGSFALVGINTFTEGYGGLFGDIGGGIVLEPYWGWISATTGLAVVPEPASWGLGVGWVAWVVVVTRRLRRPRP